MAITGMQDHVCRWQWNTGIDVQNQKKETQGPVHTEKTNKSAFLCPWHTHLVIKTCEAVSSDVGTDSPKIDIPV